MGDLLIDDHNVTYSVSKLNDTYQTLMDIKDAVMLNEDFDHHEAEYNTPNPVDHQHGLTTNDILNI